MKRTTRLAVAVSALLLATAPGFAQPVPPDPLKSPLFEMLAAKHFTGGPIEHDPRVKVIVPAIVENQAQVPITADARALPNVVKLVVIADLNPIQHVVTLSTSGRTEPYVSLRIKVEQGTPVRAAAQTSDGVWHVGSVFLEAAGGGCTAPAVGRNKPDWAVAVGETQGRAWRATDGTTRLRLKVRHPMDTGLAKDNTPAYFVERVDLKDQSGAALGSIEMFEPVSEDPTVTLITKLPPADSEVTIDGRDNNGTTFRAKVPAPFRASSLDQPVLR